MVYEFWRMNWPFDGKTEIDMVFPTPLLEGEVQEGLTIRVDPKACATKDRKGRYQFSGWNLLVEHSCDPNLAYNDIDEYEDDNWRGAYAVKEIKEGDKLTIDFNSVYWDRSECEKADVCSCNAANCTGTKKGFKYLSSEAKEMRKLMTWKRVGPPYEGERDKDKKHLGLALTPHVRVCWRRDAELKHDAPDTGSSSSSSSCSDSSISSSDDDSDEDEKKYDI